MTGAKGSAPATSSSVMPCTAVAEGGIGAPGATSRAMCSVSPCGPRRTAATSTTRSCLTSSPVVSVSRATAGTAASGSPARLLSAARKLIGTRLPSCMRARARVLSGRLERLAAGLGRDGAGVETPVQVGAHLAPFELDGVLDDLPVELLQLRRDRRPAHQRRRALAEDFRALGAVDPVPERQPALELGLDRGGGEGVDGGGRGGVIGQAAA